MPNVANWEVSWALDEEQWAVFLAELQRWITTHGSLSNLRQQDHGPNGYPLGQQVRAVRQRQRRGSLPIDQKLALEQLPGWAWNAQRARWLAQLEAARTHFANPTDGGIPTRVNDWLDHTRRAYRAGQLDHEQRALLESVPQIITPPGAAAKLANDLHTWLRDHPESTVEQIRREDHINGSRLLRRMIYLRHRYAENQLTPGEVELFSTIPGWRW